MAEKAEQDLWLFATSSAPCGSGLEQLERAGADGEGGEDGESLSLMLLFNSTSLPLSLTFLTLKFGVFSVYNKLSFFLNRLFFTNLSFYLLEDDLLDLFFFRPSLRVSWSTERPSAEYVLEREVDCGGGAGVWIAGPGSRRMESSSLAYELVKRDARHIIRRKIHVDDMNTVEPEDEARSTQGQGATSVRPPGIPDPELL